MLGGKVFSFFRAKRSRVVISDGTWDCSLCTYKNPNVAFRCEMCDSRKGTATRKPKLILNDPVERPPRSKRKTDEDYSSDGTTTDDTDNPDEDDDDDDEEFQHEERKQSQPQQHPTRRSFPNEHLNENISSPASSTRSVRSTSPFSATNMKTRTSVNSLSRSAKSTSAIGMSKSKSNPASKSKTTKSKQSSERTKTNKKTSNQQKKYLRSVFLSNKSVSSAGKKRSYPPSPRSPRPPRPPRTPPPPTPPQPSLSMGFPFASPNSPPTKHHRPPRRHRQILH